MRQMTIRKIDDRVYERLKERARTSRRSLEAEVRAILDAAVVPDRSELIRLSTEMRASLAGHYKGDVTADIRADRDR